MNEARFRMMTLALLSFLVLATPMVLATVGEETALSRPSREGRGGDRLRAAQARARETAGGQLTDDQKRVMQAVVLGNIAELKGPTSTRSSPR